MRKDYLYGKFDRKMFGKGIKESERQRTAAVAAGIYLLLVLFALLPSGLFSLSPSADAVFMYRGVLPVSVLALFSLRILPWQISLALAAAALGDIRGAAGSVLGQIEFYAVTHLFLILFFVQRWFHDMDAFSRAGVRGPANRRPQIIIISAFVVAVLAYVMIRIVSDAPAGMVRGCVGLYSVIVCMMLFFALVQRSRAYAVAAVLFVMSDATIGWDAFVARIQGGRYIILIPYFAAQLIFFLRAAHLQIWPFTLLSRRRS